MSTFWTAATELDAIAVYEAPVQIGHQRHDMLLSNCLAWAWWLVNRLSVGYLFDYRFGPCVFVDTPGPWVATVDGCIHSYLGNETLILSSKQRQVLNSKRYNSQHNWDLKVHSWLLEVSIVL